ncbi:MAG: hypothetical protein ACJAYU_003279 [Bradymonadia bacterium]|jgi:hypothetical protein
MDNKRLSYDATSKTIHYESDIAGKELLSKGAGKTLSFYARAGTYDGNPVESVQVGFADAAAAEYNADALEFLRLVAVGPDGPVRSGARFTARSDFGLE